MMDPSGLLTEKLESKGDIKLDRSNFNKDYLTAIGLPEGADTFDRVRANVVEHVFESEVEVINKSCTCKVTDEEGKCDVSECAQQRQNELLAVSSTAASASSDEYVREMEKLYGELKGMVAKINEGNNTIADFIGNMGFLSVYASTAAIEQMAIATYDLRTQSYRNLVFSGTKEEDLSQLSGGNNVDLSQLEGGK